jgi:hypothetical protein
MERSQRTEIRVMLQIDQKSDSLLSLRIIQRCLGGSIGYRASQDTYYYSTVSFGNAAKLIQYCDHTHLIGASSNMCCGDEFVCYYKSSDSKGIEMISLRTIRKRISLLGSQSYYT